MRQPRPDALRRSGTDRLPAEAATSRRLLLRRVALAAAPFAALLLAGCEKPYYDRDRGVMVFRRPRKN